MARAPHVAGSFYAKGKNELTRQIEQCFLHELGPGRLPIDIEQEEKSSAQKIIGGIVPHAGYVYSGPCAAHFYLELSKLGTKKPRIIIFGVNHSGAGYAVAASEEAWKTPLGEVEADLELAGLLEIGFDEDAHRYEHSIEVQLPFLQYLYGDDFTFLPVSITPSFDIASGVGIEKALSKLDEKVKKDIVVLASSDFTHYEDANSAKEKDGKAIEHILALDEKSFLRYVYSKELSICGYATIISAIISCKNLGARKAELLKYMNSGDVTKDYSSVVAYASIAFR